MENKVVTMENIHKRNEQLAAELNADLTKKGVFTVNVMGAPGAGKTSVLVSLIKQLNEACFVIEGDIESDIDSMKLKELGISNIQINTGGACHLDTPLIKNAVDEIDVKDCILFIENIGNLVCPAEFLIGEHIKMLICTVTEGSDKPYKYPLAFEKADVIIINKIDLTAYVSFDEAYFMKGVRALNPEVPVFSVSATTGKGFGELSQWMQSAKEKSLNKLS